MATCAAVREWDSNGTCFGYNKALGRTAGEFGHNDYYPVIIAACQQKVVVSCLCCILYLTPHHQGYGGDKAILAMILVDEIRGRLAEVFSLKSYKIDHVVHGGIAAAATYGTLDREM